MNGAVSFRRVRALCRKETWQILRFSKVKIEAPGSHVRLGALLPEARELHGQYCQQQYPKQHHEQRLPFL